MLITLAAQEKAKVLHRFSSGLTNHEMGSTSHRKSNIEAPSSAEGDVLVQLRANLSQLDDLHARLKFAMGEISYLLKRS